MLPACLKAWFCVHLSAGIGDSNLAESMVVRLLCLLRVVQVEASATCWLLLQNSPTGCVCLFVCDIEAVKTRRPVPELGL